MGSGRAGAVLALALMAVGVGQGQPLPTIPPPPVPGEVKAAPLPTVPAPSLPAEVKAAPLPTMPTPTVPGEVKAGPGSLGWPAALPPTVPNSPAPMTNVLEEPRSANHGAPDETHARPVDFLPLPGSLEDNIERELNAKRGFRYCTWYGTTITALPDNLLWTPPFAIKREARMLVEPTSQQTIFGKNSLDTSVGTTLGLFRFQPTGHDIAYQFDLFGVVRSRLATSNVIVSDYRFGLPITMRWGTWQTKLAYEHTSSHFSDRYLRAQPNTPINSVTNDELVFALGNWVIPKLRVYGQVGYSFQQTNQSPYQDRWRFDVGFEYYDPAPTGFAGTPYFAFNFDSRGNQAYVPNLTAQAGWLWRNPYERLANIRLFAEYNYGRSSYDQFMLTRENYYGVGLACDY